MISEKELAGFLAAYSDGDDAALLALSDLCAEYADSEEVVRLLDLALRTPPGAAAWESRLRVMDYPGVVLRFLRFPSGCRDVPGGYYLPWRRRADYSEDPRPWPLASYDLPRLILVLGDDDDG